MQARCDEINKKEQIRTTVMLTGMSIFFTVQTGLSYYAIFQVPWLGWDLVEPWTYSVT